MTRTVLLALTAAAALSLNASAIAKTKTAPAADQSAVAPTATTPVNALKPAQLPPHAPVVASDQTALGEVAKIYVDAAGNVSSVLVAPAGETIGKKVPASQLTLSSGQLALAMDKASFDALPQTS